MAKTKREYILATCFLSAAAAIISFVALGTQEWVVSQARPRDNIISTQDIDSVKIGLFSGVFTQTTAYQATFELTTVCAFDLNVCALLCGEDMVDNLRNIYNNEIVTVDPATCAQITATYYTEGRYIPSPREVITESDKIFINAGVWLCTILFLIISAVMGLVSACLAVWNTAASPYQVYFSIFGLYIYNAVAFFSILLAIVLYGAMFAADLIHSVPTYKTFSGDFTTEGYAQLGYSYWINLASLFLYMTSICLLYIRNYLISKEPKVNVQIEDAADPVIYLY